VIGFHLRLRRVSQEGDDALRILRQLELRVRVGFEESLEFFLRPHDGHEGFAQRFRQSRLDLRGQRFTGGGARVEGGIAAGEQRLDVREPDGFERALEVGHAEVHGADAAEQGDVAGHYPNLKFNGMTFGVMAIPIPIGGIVPDIGTDTFQRAIISDDVIMVIPLPNRVDVHAHSSRPGNADFESPDH
jgi:hypothetical protein